MKNGVIVFLILIIISCNSNNFIREGYPPLQSVGNIDVERYLGKWYEIARMPFFFEDGLVNTTATYSIMENGNIKVVNEGNREVASGKKESAYGEAWIPDQTRNAELKVSFFGPFSSDYWIIDLDKENYSYAMVSSGYKYLWILSRTPAMDDALYSGLIEKAGELGFETKKLYKVPQDW
ncbi:MAG: lipocalin family protein [Spirochaetales bacterium]|nr:lipocalin family protein [Spirochaetales bacterium]